MAVNCAGPRQAGSRASTADAALRCRPRRARTPRGAPGAQSTIIDCSCVQVTTAPERLPERTFCVTLIQRPDGAGRSPQVATDTGSRPRPARSRPSSGERTTYGLEGPATSQQARATTAACVNTAWNRLEDPSSAFSFYRWPCIAVLFDPAQPTACRSRREVSFGLEGARPEVDPTGGRGAGGSSQGRRIRNVASHAAGMTAVHRTRPPEGHQDSVSRASWPTMRSVALGTSFLAPPIFRLQPGRRKASAPSRIKTPPPARHLPATGWKDAGLIRGRLAPRGSLHELGAEPRGAKHRSLRQRGTAEGRQDPTAAGFPRLKSCSWRINRPWSFHPLLPPASAGADGEAGGHGADCPRMSPALCRWTTGRRAAEVSRVDTPVPACPAVPRPRLQHQALTSGRCASPHPSFVHRPGAGDLSAGRPSVISERQPGSRPSGAADGRRQRQGSGHLLVRAQNWRLAQSSGPSGV